jgi:hypothetical protein
MVVAAAAPANGSSETEKRNCERASERGRERAGQGHVCFANCCNATRLSWTSVSPSDKTGNWSVFPLMGIVFLLLGISGCSQNGDHP